MDDAARNGEIVECQQGGRRKEAGAAQLEVALAQHMRMHSKHQQRLHTEMEQPWSGPVVETRVGKEAGRVSVLSQGNMTARKKHRSSEAKRVCATL